MIAAFVPTGPVKRHFDSVDHWIERAASTFLIAFGIRLAETTE